MENIENIKNNYVMLILNFLTELNNVIINNQTNKNRRYLSIQIIKDDIENNYKAFVLYNYSEVLLFHKNGNLIGVYGNPLIVKNGI